MTTSMIPADGVATRALPLDLAACGRLGLRLSILVATGLLVANCAQNNMARRSGSKEIGAFSDPKYGKASQRVVEEGQPVPKGGGRDLVGKPYSIAGKRYVPYEKPQGYTQVGTASWYGEAFHGRRTANGEVYDRHGISAAHPTMPLPSYARVTNTLNGRSIIVRVNDRGPYHGGRVMDVSQKTADALAFRHLGTARIKVEYLGRASLGGSDDRKLIATLRTDGQPASLPGAGDNIQIASAQSFTPARVTPAAIANAVDANGEQETSETAAYAAPATAPQPSLVQAPVAAAAVTQPAMVQPVMTQPAAAQPVMLGRPVAGAPVPPERPFDLATIPHAGTPVSSAVPGLRPAIAPAPPQRPVLASLYYAPEQGAQTAFVKGGPFTALKPQQFQPLSRVGTR